MWNRVSFYTVNSISKESAASILKAEEQGTLNSGPYPYSSIIRLFQCLFSSHFLSIFLLLPSWTYFTSLQSYLDNSESFQSLSALYLPPTLILISLVVLSVTLVRLRFRTSFFRPFQYRLNCFRVSYSCSPSNKITPPLKRRHLKLARL